MFKKQYWQNSFPVLSDLEKVFCLNIYFPVFTDYFRWKCDHEFANDQSYFDFLIGFSCITGEIINRPRVVTVSKGKTEVGEFLTQPNQSFHVSKLQFVTEPLMGGRIGMFSLQRCATKWT